MKRIMKKDPRVAQAYGDDKFKRDINKISRELSAKLKTIKRMLKLG